jgi:acyl-CoA synthetase (AMP-forming)/AMP-acid ligase II
VLDHCRAALEPFKIPRHVCFVDEFPRSETGKPRKFKLREQALKDREGKGSG